MRSEVVVLTIALVLAVMSSGCGGSKVEGPAGVKIASGSGGGLSATLSNSKGYLSEGLNEFTLDLRGEEGKLAEVGAITLYFDMPAMGSMPYMRNDATLTTTSTPGIYRGTVTLEMKGTWRTRLSYQRTEGSGEMEFVINAK